MGAILRVNPFLEGGDIVDKLPGLAGAGSWLPVVAGIWIVGISIHPLFTDLI